MVRNNESITDIIDECELIVSVIYKGGLTMTEKTTELNSNQELVLQWLKDDLKDDSDAVNTLSSLFHLQKFGYCFDVEVIEAHKTLNVRQFMEVVKAFTDWALSDHQPTFVVGEYYWGGNVIYKVLEIEEYVDTNDIQLKVLSLNDGTTHEDTMYMEYPFDDDKPATAEQITTFKRAEHFASKGRKLDEFEVFDFVKVIRTKTVFRVKDVYERDNVKYVGDHDASLEFPVSECVIYSTAEELRGVEND